MTLSRFHKQQTKKTRMYFCIFCFETYSLKTFPTLLEINLFSVVFCCKKGERNAIVFWAPMYKLLGLKLISRGLFRKDILANFTFPPFRAICKL